MMLYHTETAPIPQVGPRVRGAKSKQTYNIEQMDILRTRLCGARAGSPQ